MSNLNTIDITTKDSISAIKATNDDVKIRRAAQGREPLILADFYQEDVNIVTWQRDLSESLQQTVKELLETKPAFQANLTVTPESVFDDMQKAFGDSEQTELSQNIAELVEMFCSLFELTHAGLRLTALDKAMCPKFHVDRVPGRLVTTYQGVATEWLPHEIVDRTKLGVGSKGLPDNESGIYQQYDNIQQLNCGDVAILKGENWHDNDDAGLVHRSPALIVDKHRLLLTLDFVV